MEWLSQYLIYKDHSYLDKLLGAAHYTKRKVPEVGLNPGQSKLNGYEAAAITITPWLLTNLFTK